MATSTIGTPEQLRDPNYTPPLGTAIPLGIQHVLAMFVSNVTPAIIVCGAAGIGFGSDQGALGFPDMTYMIQMSMLFAGIATLFQTIGFGPVGARLPIVQGTSFAFIPIMIPAVAGAGVGGLAGLLTGVMLGGVFHFCLGFFIGKIRFALPPLVTGLIVLMIGLALVRVGIQYAAGGVPLMGTDAFGSLEKWTPALVVVVVTLAVKFFMRGFAAVAAVLIGIIAGYLVAMVMGQVSFASMGRAGWFTVPTPFHWGFHLDWAIVIGMCFMAIVSAIETVGDTSGITKGGAGREATDKEIEGATFADIVSNVDEIVFSTYDPEEFYLFAFFDVSVDNFSITRDAGCTADFNDDGVLDFFDVSLFINAFGAQDPAADLNQDRAYDFFDVSAFLSAYNAGCP